MAQAAGVAPTVVNALAVAFVVFRIGHGVLYITNRQLWRSIAWLGGWLCVGALMVLAIFAIA